MGKPLLTDEIIEQARRGKRLRDEDRFGYYNPESGSYERVSSASDWEEDDEGYREGQTIRIPVEQSIVKSRRIETMKTAAFQSKVNKLLFWVIFLLILFFLAVRYL